MFTKKQIQKRLRMLKEEIVMGNHYDGWTLEGLKKEYEEKKLLLSKLNEKPIIT